MATKRRAETAPDTRAVHAGAPRDDPLGSVALPIHLSSTFDNPERAMGGPSPYIYSRYTNPTLEAVETKIAALEGTRGARVFASGMAAIATALRVLLRPGDGIIASPALYGGTRDLLDREFPELGIRVRYLPLEELTPEAIRKTRGDKDKVLYLESPTNPMLRVLDLPALIEAGHEAGLRIVIDNTFAGPMLARPAEWGADLVCESASKTMAGHSDLIAGAVATDHEGLLEALTFKRKVWGPMLDPGAAYRLYRGLMTLGVRVRRSGETARSLAQALTQQEWVKAVHHPSLETHQDHTTAQRTLNGDVPLVTFTLKGGEEAAIRMRRAVETIRPAVSLGGVESLMSLPGETSHAQLTPQQREEVGIPPGTIRLSVGLEAHEDLLEDLQQAAK
jgi:cystathionine beta-lyase/cystathionine gamma-synthase